MRSLPHKTKAAGVNDYNNRKHKNNKIGSQLTTTMMTARQRLGAFRNRICLIALLRLILLNFAAVVLVVLPSTSLAVGEYYHSYYDYDDETEEEYHHDHEGYGEEPGEAYTYDETECWIQQPGSGSKKKDDNDSNAIENACKIRGLNAVYHVRERAIQNTKYLPCNHLDTSPVQVEYPYQYEVEHSGNTNYYGYYGY